MRLAHLDQLQALDVAEQLARLRLDAQLAQPVAAIVEGHAVPKAGTDIKHAEFADQEIGQLPGFCGQLLSRFFLL